MSRRSTRKKIDYSKFNEDANDLESDDDFQDSANPPSSKRVKSVQDNSKKDAKPKQKKQSLSVNQEEQSIKNSNRKSRDEKLFEKELQAALEMSKKVQAEIINIDEEDGVEEHQQNSEGVHESKSNEGLNDKEENEDDQESDENQDENGDNEEYKMSDEAVSEDESDDDYDDYDDEDEEFKVSKTMKGKNKNSNRSQSKGKENQKQASEKKSGTQRVQATEKSFKKTTTTEAPNKESISSTSIQSPIIPTAATSRVGLKSSGSTYKKTTTTTKTLGDSASQPKNGTLNTGNCSPALAGVVIKRSGPGGLRLGLSRNVQVAKPLHSNIKPNRNL